MWAVHFSSAVYAGVRFVRGEASTSTARVRCTTSAPYTTTVWIAVSKRVCIAVPAVVHFVWPIAKATAIHTGATVTPAHTTHVRNRGTPPDSRAIRPTVVAWIVIANATIVNAAIAICDVSAVLAQCVVARTFSTLV